MTEGTKQNLPAKIDFESGSIFDKIISDFAKDMTLYDQVMNQIDPAVFDRLQKKKSHSVAGLSFVDGGIFEQRFSIAGRGSSKDDIFTAKLSVAGSANFNGLLGASENASIAGKATFEDNVMIGGKLSVAGSSTFKSNLVVSGGASIAGRAFISEFLLADSPIGISGRLDAMSIRSNNKLNLKGRIYVKEDVIARNILLDGITGVIEGNMVAEEINSTSINSLTRNEEAGEKKNLSTAGGLFSYIKNLLSEILTGRKSRILQINGNVIGDVVNLDNVNVLGDVYAKNVIVGDDVNISGTIYYSDDIQLPEGSHFNTKQGFPEKINNNVADKLKE